MNESRFSAVGARPAADPGAPHPLLRFLQGSRDEGTEGWRAADVWVLRRSNLKSLTWTLTGIGFFAFMFVVLTFRTNIGDVAVALALIGIVFQRGKVLAPRFIVILGLFVGWCGLGLLTTDYPLLAQQETLLLLKLLLIWFAAVNALRTRAQLRFFLIFCVVLYATHPVRGAILNSVLYGQTQHGRFVWLNAFGNSNGLATLTILYLSMAAALLVTEKKGLVRAGAQASIIVFAVIVALTQSRGGLLGLIVFGGLALLGQKKRARFMFMGAMIAVGGAFFVPESGWNRFGQLISITTQGTAVLEDLDDSGSARERFEILRVATAVIADHPLTGVGWGAYPRAHYNYVLRYKSDYSWFRADRVRALDAHNTFVTVLAETGWIGFGLFFMAIGLALTRAQEIKRRWASAAPLAARQIHLLQVGFIGFMVAAFFASVAHYTYFYIHLTVVWASAEILDQDMKALMQATRAPQPGGPGPVGPVQAAVPGSPFGGPPPTAAPPGA